MIKVAGKHLVAGCCVACCCVASAAVGDTVYTHILDVKQSRKPYLLYSSRAEPFH
ncbi:hypothetical protein BJX70DRAFT_366298 [Aspergillus crustosus]